MKLRKIFYILTVGIILFTFCSNANAQVTVKLQTPPLNQLKLEDLWKVTITNSSKNTYNVYLAGNVKEKNVGQVVSSKSSAFSLPPGTKIITPGNITSSKTIWSNNKLKEIILRTGSAPEGYYNICVKVMLESDNSELASDCIDHVVNIKNRISLILIKPSNADTIPKDKLSFIWSPVMNLPPNTIYSYKLKIVNINQGQTQENAMQNNPIFHEANTETNTNYLYPVSAPAMDSGKNYAWRVSVISENEVLYESVVRKFTIGIKTAVEEDTTHELPDTTFVEQDTLCMGNEVSPQVTNTTPTTKTLDQLKSGIIKVGLFNMKILDATVNNNKYTGEGSIVVNWLKTPIAVQFKDIQINEEDQLYEGTVISRLDSSAGTWPKQWLINGLGGYAWEKAKINDLNKWLQNNEGSKLTSYINRLNDQYLNEPLKLPLGMNNAKGYTIAITEMKFEANAHAQLKCVAIFPFTDNDSLGFVGELITCTPSNPSFNAGVIRLLQNESIGGGDNQSYTINSGTGGTGTFISWDCKGFKQLSIDMDIGLPRNWLKPKPDNGTSKVQCNVKANITDWNDWIAGVTLPKSTISGTQGLELEVSSMHYDHSDVRNTANMVFPSNYEGDNGLTFQGFYLKNAKIDFPDNFRSYADTTKKLSVAFNNVIINNTGLTGSLVTYNLYDFGNNKGNISGMGASLDTFKLKMVNSSLDSAYLSGRIILPISSDKDSNSLHYKALFTESSSFQFVINPINPIKAKLFADANITLDNTSTIVVNINKKFDFESKLNGSFGWTNVDIGHVKKVNIGLKFQNFKSGYSSSGGFYFDKGSWSFASAQKWLGNFPITLNSVDIVNKTAVSGEIKRSGLRFSVSLNLTENLGGNTIFDVIGAISIGSNGRFVPSFVGAEIDSISILANFPAVKLDGKIGFFHDNSTYGNGFNGKVKATFSMTKMEIDAGLTMGSLIPTRPPGPAYRYWYVDAKVIFPKTMAVPFMPGFAFYGFGAAAWKNMTTPDSAGLCLNITQVNNAQHLSSTNTSVSWIPSQNGGFGFKVIAVIGTYPEPKTLNADVGLSAQFSGSGGFEKIEFFGKLWAIANFDERSNAPIKGGLYVNYNIPTKEFGLSSNVYIKYPAIGSDSGKILSGEGSFDVYVNGTTGKWSVLFGVPDNPNHITILQKGNIWTYFMCGNDIGQYVRSGFQDVTNTHLAAISDNKINTTPRTDTSANTRYGKGFAFGVGFHYGDPNNWKDVPYTLGVIQYKFFCGTEINLSVLNYGNAACGSYSPIGYKGWYTKGNLAVWISGQVRSSAKIWPTDWCGYRPCGWDHVSVGLSAAAWVEGGFPNPIYIKGGVYISVPILGSKYVPFKYGPDECSSNIQSIETQNQFQQENATENIGNLINYTYPSSSSNRVDPKAPIRIAYSFDPGQEFEISEQQSDGTIKVRIFKVTYSQTLQATCSAPIGATMFYTGSPYPISIQLYSHGKNTSGEYKYMTYSAKIKIPQNSNLEGEKGYRLIINGTLWEKYRGTWRNTNITESKTVNFLTDILIQ